MDNTAWLLFIYQLPASPSTHRSYVWRKLKALGALYLQNSFCLLPCIPALEKTLMELRGEIGARGGEAQLFHIDLNEADERQSITERFKTQMRDEYVEFIEQCDGLHAELANERKIRHFTFGELEENDAELNKLRSWLPKLIERDYFVVELRQRAVEALQSCEEDFAVFEKEVEERGNGGP